MPEGAGAHGVAGGRQPDSGLEVPAVNTASPGHGDFSKLANTPAVTAPITPEATTAPMMRGKTNDPCRGLRS